MSNVGEFLFIRFCLLLALQVSAARRGSHGLTRVVMGCNPWKKDRGDDDDDPRVPELSMTWTFVFLTSTRTGTKYDINCILNFHAYQNLVWKDFDFTLWVAWTFYNGKIRWMWGTKRPQFSAIIWYSFMSKALVANRLKLWIFFFLVGLLSWILSW